MTGLDRWQELREAAAAATPGPWTVDGPWWHRGGDVDPDCCAMITAAQDRQAIAIAPPREDRGNVSDADMRFIAQADPAAVLSLLEVVDRQARQLAAVEKCIADMRLTADLARSRVPAGEPSFVAEAIHEACNNVAAALAGGEVNHDQT